MASSMNTCWDVTFWLAPVYLEAREDWDVYLPEGGWVHLWTGDVYQGGDVNVEAPLGYTPAFYLKDSSYAPLFEEIRRKYGTAASRD